MTEPEPYKLELAGREFNLVIEALEEQADVLELMAANRHVSERYRQHHRDRAQLHRHLAESLRLQKEHRGD